jgi:hypothetical protein
VKKLEFQPKIRKLGGRGLPIENHYSTPFVPADVEVVEVRLKSGKWIRLRHDIVVVDAQLDL